MKRLIALLLSLAMLISFAGCNGRADPPNETTQPQATTSVDPLAQLREEMDSKMLAVADFGFPRLSENIDPMTHLRTAYGGWLEGYDFIRDIPEEQIIITCGYDERPNLVCIVPQDPNATVRVNVSRYIDEEPYQKVDVVYYAKTGDPILLVADRNVFVEIADSQGKETTWYPNLGGTEPFPGNAWFDGLVLDISPVSQENGYQQSLAEGWVVPDESFRTYHYWRSDYGYLLELYYEPNELYDGRAIIYAFSGYDEYDGEYYIGLYYGDWLYVDGKLHLKVSDPQWNEFEAELPILTDPNGDDVVRIFPSEDGKVLPLFGETMRYDHLTRYASDSMSFYDYSLSMGWRLPELWELLDTEWTSTLGYALDLKEDAVPGDNGGNVVLYDVSDNGAYTQSYTGAWSYADGMLHLLLVPKNDGQFIDDSFPVLMLDGELMILLNEYGLGLPHFYGDTMADVLVKPAG